MIPIRISRCTGRHDNVFEPKHSKVLDRIREKSSTSRQAYLARIESMRTQGPNRNAMGCSNLAHGFAACGASDKQALKGERP